MKSKATSHFFFTKFKEIYELREIMGKQVKVIDIATLEYKFLDFMNFTISGLSK